MLLSRPSPPSLKQSKRETVQQVIQLALVSQEPASVVSKTSETLGGSHGAELSLTSQTELEDRLTLDIHKIQSALEEALTHNDRQEIELIDVRKVIDELRQGGSEVVSTVHVFNVPRITGAERQAGQYAS